MHCMQRGGLGIAHLGDAHVDANSHGGQHLVLVQTIDTHHEVASQIVHICHCTCQIWLLEYGVLQAHIETITKWHQTSLEIQQKVVQENDAAIINQECVPFLPSYPLLQQELRFTSLSYAASAASAYLRRVTGEIVQQSHLRILQLPQVVGPLQSMDDPLLQMPSIRFPVPAVSCGPQTTFARLEEMVCVIRMMHLWSLNQRVVEVLQGWWQAASLVHSQPVRIVSIVIVSLSMLTERITVSLHGRKYLTPCNRRADTTSSLCQHFIIGSTARMIASAFCLSGKKYWKNLLG